MTKTCDPNEEDALNPPPKKYSVSARTKTLFLLFFCFGIAFYFYMIIQRRTLQHRYQLENQMAGIKLAPKVMPSLAVFDPKTAAEIKLEPKPGRWMLLNLWATWCPPCREEMPSFELLAQRFGHKLDVIALSMDDNVAAVDEFIAAHKPGFSILWDKERKAADVFLVSKYPETFLISPEGVLSVQFSGPRDWSSASSLAYFDRVLAP